MKTSIANTWLQLNGKYKCPYCGAEYSRMGIHTHIWRKHGAGINHDPNSTYVYGTRTAWNKGKTKDTHPSLQQAANTYKARVANGEIIPPHKGKKLSTEFRKKISKTISDKVANGTWHYSFSKVRSHPYESKHNGIVNLMGSWELAYAKYLDDNNIEWKRPKDKFYYEFEGLKSGKGFYTPDFYLVKSDTWVEIKGYETAKDRAKWQFFPHKLVVLKCDDLHNLGIVNITT